MCTAAAVCDRLGIHIFYQGLQMSLGAELG